MKFGLNLQKKKAPINSTILRKPSAFANTTDDELENEEEDTLQNESNSKKNQKARTQVNRQLSGYNTMTKKIAEEQAKALEEDPTIFDYDAVYDDLKEVERKKKEALKPDSKKPKYITGLLEMAEIRKRDRLIAEEKKVAREREEEGEEFAGKEVFITESFKKQKAELERIEREEREREALAEKNRGMDTFYKQVLERKEAEHQAMMKAIAERSKNKNSNQSTLVDSNIDDETKLVEQAKREGKNVIVNDNNEIVDKRQLLGAGLNVKPKFGSLKSLAASDERIKERVEEYERYKRKKLEEYESRRRQGKSKDERERLSKEVEKQMLELKKKEEEEEERKRKEVEQKAVAKRTTEDAAMSARERYLARKKQKLEAEKKNQNK
ncbi:coiled-coil domain-containing protein 55-domain containing protein [Cokeromyces recurvatus]|uniref:coiled-coil domain-containing protein 55-domain containing protein n=1 Tax=Cokeromyces recurvatus TaxID=90255 RepID=UPI0022200629|nr:coiled-coil domain-containing protein 55-domain containing protein [Cokeromyces recurvatus]KAI7897686.1 coiled-coil domain-containing protein 55-domain containing protein [Cokeromyces recurvatus]